LLRAHASILTPRLPFRSCSGLPVRKRIRRAKRTCACLLGRRFLRAVALRRLLVQPVKSVPRSFVHIHLRGFQPLPCSLEEARSRTFHCRRREHTITAALSDSRLKTETIRHEDVGYLGVSGLQPKT
jgi:hypothetical protein